MPEAPHPEDEPLRSTVQELEDFKKSRIWHDIKSFLEDRRELIHQKMKTVDNLEALRELQGRLQNTEEILELPDSFLNELGGNDNG